MRCTHPIRATITTLTLEPVNLKPLISNIGKRNNNLYTNGAWERRDLCTTKDGNGKSKIE
jgi:hypothetical protein